jgi:hypothetical protein
MMDSALDLYRSTREIIMPMITVQYSTSRSERGLKAAVAQAASDLAAQILRKDPKVTAVLGSGLIT